MNQINLHGTIGEEGLTAPDVKAQIAAFPDHTAELVVSIDSPGGSVLAGFSMFKAFEAYPGPKRALIESAAFSIASYLPMAFDSVEIADNGYLMIHNPSLDSGGDDEDHARDSKLLADMKADMIKAYSSKTGIDPDKLQSMMKSETYLNATEAVASGFADRVMGNQVVSRIVTAYKNHMPYRVVASLMSDAPRGDNEPTKGKPMSEDQKPVAATVADIKTAFPKASSDFIVRCVEKKMPIASVATAAAEELLAENEELKAKLQAMEEESETAKAKAMEEEEASAKAMEEEETAQAQAKGNQPVARAGGTATASGTASGLWSKAVDTEMEKNRGNRQKAVLAANRKNPGLREKMLAERNA